MLKRYIYKILLIACCLCLVSCGSEPGSGGRADTEGSQAQEREFFAMDTYMTFTAYGQEADTALQAAEEEIHKLEGEWSVTDENSQIYKINHSQGAPVTLSEDTAKILDFALEMARQTDGALDPTIYPIMTAWGFTTDQNRIPSSEEIESLLENVGYEQAALNGNQIQLPAGMELDLGAVGKGYAGDLAAEILKDRGITSALLDIGGNIQAIGSRPDGSNWRLGIRNPFGEGQVGVLSVSDRAVVTSGNYERYFAGDDGQTYGHIIDPSTGYPADTGLASVTIIAEEGKVGDALSTAMFVKVPQEAEEYWRAHQDFDMLMITEDGEIRLTEGIQDSFTLSGSFANMEVQVIRSQ